MEKPGDIILCSSSKRCVLPSGPDDTARLTRKGFVILCKDRHGYATGALKKNAWERQEDYGQCKECETGKLVARGKDFNAPPGVEFIEIGEIMKQQR